MNALFPSALTVTCVPLLALLAVPVAAQSVDDVAETCQRRFGSWMRVNLPPGYSLC